MGAAVDHTGVRYGRAVGISRAGKKKNSQIVWVWKCDCGEEFESVAGNFVHNNNGACEKCVANTRNSALRESTTFHGMTNTKEYKSWLKIRERCFYEKCVEYSRYGARGITMYPSWIDSFSEFYSYIGPMPIDGQKYSCDRIDNNKGYVPGNIRWATSKQQCRNKGKMKNNSSGYTGVHIEDKIHPNGTNFTTYAVAQWYNTYGKMCKKSFSFNKYGEELAILCAVEARDQAIRLLNQQGAGYSPNHGK